MCIGYRFITFNLAEVSNINTAKTFILVLYGINRSTNSSQVESSPSSKIFSTTLTRLVEDTLTCNVMFTPTSMVDFLHSSSRSLNNGIMARMVKYTLNGVVLRLVDTLTSIPNTSLKNI